MNAPILGPILPPVRKVVRIPWSVERAFRRFTSELASWWPLATHSLGGSEAVTCRFEERVGGEIFETHRDGSRVVWGTVQVWEPPTRVRFTWHPGEDPAGFGEVELRFFPEGDGARLELVHSGWERRGASARSARRTYNLGWVYVLEVYAGRRGLRVRTLDLVGAMARRLQRRRAGRQGEPS